MAHYIGVDLHKCTEVFRMWPRTSISLSGRDLEKFMTTRAWSAS